MALSNRLVVLCLLVSLAACRQGGEPGPRPDAGADAGNSADGGTGTDGGRDANIEEVLGCTPPLGVNGTAQPNELQLHVVDTRRFPDALCNDGSPPILYYRPFRGAANRNKWLLSLRGGGGCGSGPACAARWCACSDAHPCAYSDTKGIFTANNMSGSGRRGESGGGVDGRDPRNPTPFDDFNQVQFHYCSSDAWRGNARGVEYTTVHPRRGDTVTYVMHFLGASILDADIATLQQENVGALEYTLGGGSVPMPDLDEATQVVITGDSGGATGVIERLDAVAERLRASHVPGPAPEIHGIIDAAAGPEQSRLDYQSSSYAARDLRTYDQIMAVLPTAPANKDARVDSSCLAYHAPRNSTGWCFDETHVIRHHLTTPFFYRMALLDSGISTFYVTDDIRDPDRGGRTFKDDVGFFGVVLHDELKRFGALPTLTQPDHEQGTVAPGVFAPACSFHDTIHNSTQTFGTTITPAGTSTAKALLDVYAAWRADPNSADARLLTESTTRADTVCP